MAQETFITAWKHLRLLREPDKLRAWLCGIVRNRIHKSLQREGREPVHRAEPLERVDDAPAREALPSEQTIRREEEAILWRSLEKIPELYREPLILFYREHQSIERVAAELELSEDAVKQRLSRGRKMLQEEVQAFVENTLSRTAPGQAFSGAVLAALPAVPAAAAGAGAGGQRHGGGQIGFSGRMAGADYRDCGRHAGTLADCPGRSHGRRTAGQEDCVHQYVGFCAGLVYSRPACLAGLESATGVE